MEKNISKKIYKVLGAIFIQGVQYIRFPLKSLNFSSNVGTSSFGLRICCSCWIEKGYPSIPSFQLLYIYVYTWISCNNDVWVWKVLFHKFDKVKIQVLEFSTGTIENWRTWFSAEFLSDCSEKLMKFRALGTVIWSI